MTTPSASKPLASDTAMILAAGLGKRMRPLTASRPKPLVRIAGKPLIDYALDRLESAGISRAVVNVHYLGNSLEAHLLGRSGKPDIVISDERARLLETGGALIHARALLPDPFFCLNSDNIWLEGPRNVFQELSDLWNDGAMDALLALVPHTAARNYRGAGDFHLDPRGQVTRRRPDKIAPFVFSGIQLVSHRLLQGAPEGAFSTNLLWNKAMGSGRLYGMVFTGLWFEVGTPGAIAPTETALNAC